MITATILGLPIQAPSVEELQTLLTTFLHDGKSHHIVTLNPEYVVAAQKLPRLADIIRTASLVVPDGIGLLFVGRFAGARIPYANRVTGVHLTELLLTMAHEQELAVVCVLLPISLTTPEELMNALHQRYPNIRATVVLAEELQTTTALRTASLLLVGTGSPDQDYRISDLSKTSFTIPIAVGIGGTFDFISGKMKRAPHLFQQLGMEWLWRLFLEPWRIRRIIRAVIVFPFLVLTKRP